MKIVITGGAGFIGSNLVKSALDRGHEVTVIDDFSTGYRANLKGLDVRLIEGTVLDAELLDTGMGGMDSIVHLAALGSVPRSVADPVASHAANATGTLQVLEAARRAGIRHVIAASSSSVYGRNRVLPKSERDWVRPLSPYAVTKLAAEQYVLCYQEAFGLETLAFRFFNVYGPGQRPGHAYAAVIPVFIDALLGGRPLPINGDGTTSRDFTFVGTVCGILMEAVEGRRSHPEPVNLAFGTNTNLIELATMIGEVAGQAPILEYRPPRHGDVTASRANNLVLCGLFPRSEPVGLRTGLEETLAWFKGMS